MTSKPSCSCWLMRSCNPTGVTATELAALTHAMTFKEATNDYNKRVLLCGVKHKMDSGVYLTYIVYRDRQSSKLTCQTCKGVMEQMIKEGKAGDIF